MNDIEGVLRSEERGCTENKICFSCGEGKNVSQRIVGFILDHVYNFSKHLMHDLLKLASRRPLVSFQSYTQTTQTFQQMH